MKKYDVVIPLGEFCLAAIALRDSGIRQASYPFDWSGAKDYSKCGNCGFMGKINMICNDFKDAFLLEDLKEFYYDNKAHRAVFNKRTGLQYVHDFDWDKSVAEQYPAYLEKYQRRVKRLYDDINQNKKILFVFVTRGEHKLFLDEISTGLKLLNEKFPQKEIDLLLIQDSTDCELSETEYFKINEHVFIYLYRDIPSSGISNQNILKKILSAFIKGHYEYNFSTDNIKNYGLSVKENWGRWSDGKEVFLDVPVFENSNLRIDFSINPYVVKEHTTQDVEVLLEGEKIADWHFEWQKEHPKTILEIPVDQITAPSLVLQFKIKNPVSLIELNLGNNNRKLGIGFRTMKIEKI